MPQDELTCLTVEPHASFRDQSPEPQFTGWRNRFSEHARLSVDRPLASESTTLAARRLNGSAVSLRGVFVARAPIPGLGIAQRDNSWNSQARIQRRSVRAASSR